MQPIDLAALKQPLLSCAKSKRARMYMHSTLKKKKKNLDFIVERRALSSSAAAEEKEAGCGWLSPEAPGDIWLIFRHGCRETVPSLRAAGVIALHLRVLQQISRAVGPHNGNPLTWCVLARRGKTASASGHGYHIRRRPGFAGSCNVLLWSVITPDCISFFFSLLFLSVFCTQSKRYSSHIQRRAIA